MNASKNKNQFLVLKMAVLANALLHHLWKSVYKYCQGPFFGSRAARAEQAGEGGWSGVSNMNFFNLRPERSVFSCFTWNNELFIRSWQFRICKDNFRSVFRSWDIHDQSFKQKRLYLDKTGTHENFKGSFREVFASAMLCKKSKMNFKKKFVLF